MLFLLLYLSHTGATFKKATISKYSKVGTSSKEKSGWVWALLKSSMALAHNAML